MKRPLTVALLLALGVFSLREPVKNLLHRVAGRKTVADRVRQFEPAVKSRLSPNFKRIGVPYPPREMILVGLKKSEFWRFGFPTRPDF